MKIPLDGMVTRGESFVDGKLLSGEPYLSQKQTLAPRFLAGHHLTKRDLSVQSVSKTVPLDTLLVSIITRVKQGAGRQGPHSENGGQSDLGICALRFWLFPLHLWFWAFSGH